MPNIILWLMKQEPLHCSQFTLDWLELTIEKYQFMQEDEVLPSETDTNGAMKYEAENILAILKPGLPDVEFFNQILTQVAS